MADTGRSSGGVVTEQMIRNSVVTDVLVVGVVSIDRLRIGGKSFCTVGGAGLYTAIAVQFVGSSVELFAPRPASMPNMLKTIDGYLHWFGPQISLHELPQLEITHHGNDVATLNSIDWGAEIKLDPEDLPSDLSECKIVHLAALSSAERQLHFVKACRARGAQLISAGTYSYVVQHEPEAVLKLIKEADIFFMNENEATKLFGSIDNIVVDPGKLVFVTLGRNGAIVLTGDLSDGIPAKSVEEFDPTGAGDTFCGATLAGLSHGILPQDAVTKAIDLAGLVVTGLGPQSLLS